MIVKAYRDYITDTGERVRVVGFERIDSEVWVWARSVGQAKSHLTGKSPRMLCHPSRLKEEAV